MNNYKKFGYNTVVASSGEEALEICSRLEHDIELVILDLGMPGMGGYRCLQRCLEINPDLKIIIASGYSINGQVKNTLEAGARGFIGKPYQINQMLKKIRSILDGGEDY